MEKVNKKFIKNKNQVAFNVLTEDRVWLLGQLKDTQKSSFKSSWSFPNILRKPSLPFQKPGIA